MQSIRRRRLNWRSLLLGLLVCSWLISNTELPGVVAQTQTTPTPQPASNDQTNLVGTFYMISGGPKPYFYLLDDSGKNYELFIDEAVLAAGGGATELNRSRVQLSAASLGLSRTLDGGAALRVSSIQPEVTPGKNSGGVTKQAVTGSRPFVNILCRFADSTTSTPKDPSYFTGLMSNTRPGLDHFFRETSLGAIDLVGTQVVGWFDLPQPRSYYFTADPPNFSRMANDCSALADSVINFNDFQGINFIFNQNFGCCAWGGAIGINLDGTLKAWPATWMPPGGFFQSIFAHEMGHAFGMPHSANVLGTTYQNAWDVMSQDRYNCGADTSPTYGCIGQHSIAYHKDIPGWIPADRKFIAPVEGASAVTLERLAQPGSTGYLMAKIPLKNISYKYYTVEARYRLGYDTKVANDAVIIHFVDTSRLDDAWIMDSDGNATSSDAGAQWLPGETFTDSANGISIKVDSATASGFVITINSQPPNDLTINANPIEGNIATAGDTNWFKVVAPRATVYSFETFSSGVLSDTIVKLYQSDGLTVLAQNDDIGSGNTMSRIYRKSLTPGTYYIAVTDKAGTHTGNYSVQATAPLIVTKNNDAAAEAGTLSYAIGQALTGDTVILAPSSGNVISLNQTLSIDKNITIQGLCERGALVTLDGTNVSGTNPGVTLGSNVKLSGMKITGFAGLQLKTSGTKNQLYCVQVVNK